MWDRSDGITIRESFIKYLLLSHELRHFDNAVDEQYLYKLSMLQDHATLP